MQPEFGLTEKDLSIILDVLSRTEHVEIAIIFGSRAKGNYKTGSDVDIALNGRNLCVEDITRISYWLNEETILPYKFDIVNYHTLKESALTAHIDRVGIVIYNKENSRES
jgi:predicted nucleotidyltransferase